MFPKLPKSLQRILLICAALFGLASIVLTFVEALTFPNFVYSRFRIQYDQLGFISLTLAIVYLSTIELSRIKKHFSSILFYTAPTLVALFFVMHFWPQDFFLKMVAEDHFIENAQFVVLILGAVFSSFLSYFYKTHDQLKAIVFGIVAGGLFLIAGDEISWGQRMFSIATPEFIGSINAQNEITFHNNYMVDGLIKWGYMFVGFYGAYAWLFFRFLPKLAKKVPSVFVPYWFLTWFFFTGFIYNFYTLLPGHLFGEWSEIAELMLYAGITLHIATVYLLLKDKSLSTV